VKPGSTVRSAWNVRHLRDDENVLRTMPLAAVTDAVPAGLQGTGQTRRGILERRDQPEREPREQSHRQRDRQSTRVQRNLVEARQVRRSERDQQIENRISDDDAEHARGQSEQCALE
jgi:hypothetical protein